MSFGLLVPHFQKIMRAYGLLALLFVCIVLLLSYYGVLSFESTKLSAVPYFLWVYLFINLLSAWGSYHQIRNKNPICPKCQSKLDEEISYECTRCGRLDFKETSKS